MKRHSMLIFFIVLAVMLAGCSRGVQPQELMPEKTGAAMDGEPVATGEAASDDMAKPESTDMMDAAPTDEMMEDGTAIPDTGKTPDDMMNDDESQGDDGMSDDMGVMMEAPAWFAAELIDVRTGEPFTVAGLEGKVVLVETMAMWCPNCLQQQRQVVELNERLGMRDDFVVLSLDVDPNEEADALREYAEQHGFDWMYAVAPAEVASEFASLYGDQFLNPSSTPMLVIDQHGEVHLLPFGIKDAESLYQALQPYLEEGM